jgi:hypothetical protein
MIKTRLIVFLFLLILFKIDGFDSDDLEKVKAIEAVATRGSRYKLYPAELFDGEMPWKISRGSSFLDTTSFIFLVICIQLLDNSISFYPTKLKAESKSGLRLFHNKVL